jgi:branched-chain amino acid transport system ATP-binding protein
MRRSSRPTWVRNTALLRIDKIDVYYGDVQILWEISLDVQTSEIVSLVGGNGAGKTTLINTLTGLIRPRRGSIVFEDGAIENARPDQIVGKGLVQVPEGRQLFGKLTVLENLEMGAINQRAKPGRPETLKRVYTLFPILEERRYQRAATLSGGEQQMLAIGRGLMALPRLLILDEPSLGLAPILIKSIFSTVVNINQQEQLTIFLVEQNLNASLQMSHRGYVLENGRIVLEGTGQELLQDEHTKRAYLGM